MQVDIRDRKIIIYLPEKKVKLNNHRYDISNAIKDLDYHPEYSYKKMLMDMKEEMLNDRFSCIKK